MRNDDDLPADVQFNNLVDQIGGFVLGVAAAAVVLAIVAGIAAVCFAVAAVG